MQILQTQRLNLRHITPADAAFMLALLNDPSFIKYIGDRGVRTLEQASEYISNKMVKSYDENGFGLYLTELKEDHTPIGICGLVNRDTLNDIDIGFGFLSAYKGKGYGYESASAVMDFAKNKLGLHRIVGITSKENIFSIKLLEKLGLRYEKTIVLDQDDTVELYGANLHTGPTDSGKKSRQ